MYAHVRQELERKIEALNIKQQKFDDGIETLNVLLQRFENAYAALGILQQKVESNLAVLNVQLEPQGKIETLNVQPELHAKSDTLRSDLIKKGLDAGHVELLTGEVMQHIIARYIALELISAVIIDGTLTVKEFEVLNICTKQFSININNIPDYLAVIRKYEVTGDKIDLLGKTGFSFSDQVKTVADFEYVMDIISKHSITEEQCKFLKAFFPKFSDVNDFKEALEVFSKHPLNQDQISALGTDIIESGTIVKDAKHLDMLISNLEKYGSITKSFSASFWEKLGYTYEVKVADTKAIDNLPESNEVLVQPVHTDVVEEV